MAQVIAVRTIKNNDCTHIHVKGYMNVKTNTEIQDTCETWK